MVKDPKKIVRQLVRDIGKHHAQKLLMIEGLSSSTSNKLVVDKYNHQLSQLTTRAIERAAASAKAEATS